MGEPLKVELHGELEGRHLLVDKRKLNVGFMVDLQSKDWGMIVGALSRAIVGGDLPEGCDLAGLRELSMDEVADVAGALTGVMVVPKSGAK